MEQSCAKARCGLARGRSPDFPVLFPDAMFLPSATLASGMVTLAWNPSTNPTVAGYNVYYGGASGIYTNVVSAGNATNITISGLVAGLTYYFAATTYSDSGVESPFPAR